MSNNPLANLGDLTKPATVLIEKISDAVGGVFKPFQIVRVARAEAEAELIHAEAQIRVSDLQRRAMHRFLVEEAKRQSNIESITQKALPLLDEKASPQGVEDDWITNFFDKSRIISDEEMQRLWSKLLAGEANNPGTFSKRTVNLLGDLDKRDAEFFTSLCGFVWVIAQSPVPIVFDAHVDIYNRESINFGILSHLETLGLIQFGPLAGFRRTNLPKNITVSYFGRALELTLHLETANQLDTGKVLFTQAGHELALVCGSKPADQFFDFVYERWAAQGLAPTKAKL